MMKDHICEEGTELIYEEVKGAEFNSIEIWIKFGSAQDPKDNIGIAHLIEHLLIPENLLNIDLYARKNTYATTSKERIRIYTKVKKEKTLDVLECFLENISTLNSSEYNFEYERLKVIQEILYLKKAPIVLCIQEAEKELFKDSGYGNLTAGEEEGVENIDRTFINTYLKKRVKENRVIISVSGEIDINKVKQAIDKYLPSTYKKEEISPIDSLEASIITSTSKLPGNLYIFNTKRQDVDQDLNYILDNLLEEFIRYKFIKEFISLKKIDYNFYKFLTIYIPNTIDKKELINEIYNIPFSHIDENMFNIVKNYVYDEHKYMSLNCDHIAHYNANKIFSNRKYNLKEILAILKNIDSEMLKKHIGSVIKEDRTIKVIGRK